MAYNSKYTGQEVDNLLDKINNDNVGEIDSALSSTSENPVMNKVVTERFNGVDAEVANRVPFSVFSPFALETTESLESNDVLIEDLQDNKADTSGYYPELHVGLSDNLPDRGDIVEGVIGFRASAGDGNSIEDGVANVKELLGDSVVWNQGIQNPSFKDGVSKWGVYGNSTLSIDIDGSLLVTAKSQGSRGFYQPVYKTPKNHTLLCLVDFKPNALGEGISYFYTYGGVTARYSFSSLSRQIAWCIITPTRETDLVFYPILSGEIGDTANVYSVRVIDLTLMFGAGNEPTTIEEFNAFCNQLVGVDLNAYNAGEVLGVHAKGIKSVNDNAWDEEWEVGGLQANGLPSADANRIRSKNYITVFPREYNCNKSLTVFFYDWDYNIISYQVVANTFTPPSNCRYIKFYYYGVTTYNNDICIRLAHSGYKTDYVAHEESKSSFDLSEYFPYGMHGIGEVRDSATPSKATRRIGRVNLGDYSWVKGSSEGLFYVLGAPITPGVKTPINNAISVNALVMGYDTISRSALDSTSIKSFAINSNGSPYMRDTAYTDAASFKEAMSGVYLYYELAEPIETEIDPKQNFSYEVWDFGTEEMLSDVPSTPVITRTIYGFNATDTIRGNKAKNEEQDARLDDIETTMVQKGDYAPALTAGFADNLVSKDMVVDSEFNLRRSGGGAISDGVARMEVVKGNSVVWNQNIQNADFRNGTQGWYNYNTLLSVNADGSVRVTNVKGESQGIYQDYKGSIQANNKVLLWINYKRYGDTSSNVRFYLGKAGGGYDSASVQVTQSQEWCAAIISTTDNIISFRLYPYADGEVDSYCDIFNCGAINLTQMFGAGNEPTTIEEFYARIPQNVDLYAYNEGGVIHMDADAIKSVGVNQWDEEWEVGKYDVNNGSITKGQNQIRNANPIPVLPSTNYYLNGSFAYLAFLEYDNDKNFLRNRGGVKGAITTSSDCSYVRFYTDSNYGETYKNDICLNLSDPDFNGQYEPYKEDVRELPSAIKEVFPYGMMSAGAAHDVAYNDLNKEVGVTEKRIGVVDMGDLDWEFYNTNNTMSLNPTIVKNLNMALVKNALTPSNAICNIFSAAPTYDVSNLDNAIIGPFASSYEGRFMIKATSYTDAASFKAAMQGVMLYYELAEPIVTEHQEPFNLDYQVANGGQEQAMTTEPTSAFKAEIAYGFNASAKIKENANEIAQLKATIAQLQATLASMVNANVEEVE